MKRILNPLFIVHLLVITFVVIGILPRSVILGDTLVLGIYFLLAPLEDGLVFFVRSIPLFIAIPLTATYDNLNMWRIFSIIIFCKWICSAEAFSYLKKQIQLYAKKPLEYTRNHKVHLIFHILTILALLSLWHASDRGVGLKRIIYFINAGLIGIVIAYHNRSKEFYNRLIKNITIPVMIVTLVGYIQVISTYFIDIYQFMRIWGEDIEFRLFGMQWSYIAVHVGNTWFAYFGNQLSLRTFSLFPDSHSFPIFLLLGIPAFFAWTLLAPLNKERLKEMIHTRGKLAVLWIPAIFLIMILSGTRGIWAGAMVMVIWSILVLWYLKRHQIAAHIRNSFTYISYYLLVFFLLFLVAYPIFSSPQFLVSKGDALLLERRLASILDFGETSNSLRLEIWKKSLQSIIHHPILGVGIGNFPVVLNQNIILARAGSSAHNIYLHIAAEMGILALLVSLYFIWLIVQAIYTNSISASSTFARAYFGSLLITIPWIFVYLMTDVAIFDERALLLFVTTLAISFNYGT